MKNVSAAPFYMTQMQMEEYVGNDYIAYARILGFCQTAAPLLKELKAHTAVPMISKLSGAHQLLSPEGHSMLEQDIRAAHLQEFIMEQGRKIIAADREAAV